MMPLDIASQIQCEAGDLWPREYLHALPLIYSIIAKNIRYLLWNRDAWFSLNNTYQTFLAPCFRCTDHLCDSCALNGINQHFVPSLLPVISKCLPIVTSSTHEPFAGNCDVTMTDCSRGVSMNAFLSQWRWDQWFKELVKYMSVPSFSSFITQRICGCVNCWRQKICQSDSWRAGIVSTNLQIAVEKLFTSWFFFFVHFPVYFGTPCFNTGYR